jgi:hypothetical protein
LFLEKTLRYDIPGRHDQKQQAMRIVGSPHLIDCKPVQERPAQSKPARVARRYLSAWAYLSGATRMRSRAASLFFVCRSHADMT